MKSILLIGGNGYIGSFLKLLFEDKYSVEIVDINWFAKNNENLPVDFKDLDKSFLSKFDIIILLAGHSSVKMCDGNMSSSFQNNVNNFIDLIGKITTQKFIYASSSSVYGNCEISNVNENYNNFDFNNFYDLSKLIIDSYVKKSGIEYYGLRFGTVNGWSPNLRSDLMINSMVNSAIECAHIKLYIKDIMRPILGIEDLGRAIIKIIENDNNYSGIYNLASFNMMAEDIAKQVSEFTNVPIIEYSVDNIEKISNVKLQSKAYDFSIDTNLFEKKFNFEFIDTIESIVKKLLLEWDNCDKSTRSEFKLYQ